MTDSREKGKRGEYQVRDILRDKTGIQWERVPGSGAFGQSHHLKGDIYIPPSEPYTSKYCIEVKWYANDNITSNILNTTESMIEKWWGQTIREAEQMHMLPLLIFKKDRGDWIMAVRSDDPLVDHILMLSHLVLNKNSQEVIMCKFNDFIKLGLANNLVEKR